MLCDVLASSLGKQEIDDKRCGSDPHERLDLLATTRNQSNDDIGDKAHANAVGDGVRKGDTCDDHEGREAPQEVGPVDVDHVSHHEEANDNKGAAGGSAAHNRDHRSEECRKDEEECP